MIMNETYLDQPQGYNVLHNVPKQSEPNHNVPYLPSTHADIPLERTLSHSEKRDESFVTEACEGLLCFDFWDPTWLNFSNGSSLEGEGGRWLHEDIMPVTDITNWYVLLLVLVVFAGVTGNLLVCIAITIERKLQNVTNYFLLSLSIADLFVCFFVMPCSIVNELMGYWPFGLIVCDIWQVLDVMMCTSSIMHMCTISLDRYITMSNPLKTRNKSRTVVGIKIATVWLISLTIASPIILLSLLDNENVLSWDNQCAIFNPYFLIYGSLAAFFIPLVIMLIAYTLTIRLLSIQASKCSNRGSAGMRRSLSKRRASSDKVNKITNNTQNGMNLAKLLKVSIDRGRAHPSEVEPLHRKQSQQDRARSSNSESTEIPSSNRKSSTLSSSSTKTGQTNLLCVNLGSHRLSQSSIQSNSSGGSSETGGGQPKFQSLMKKHSGAIKAAGILLAKREENNKKRQLNAVKTERKAVKVLGTMFAIFVICWAPFFSINFAMGVCETCDIEVALFKVFLWLGYVSSTLNPIIYTIFNKTFKKTFLRILRCQINKKPRRQATFSNQQGKSNGTATRVKCRYGELPNPEQFQNLQESNV